GTLVMNPGATRTPITATAVPSDTSHAHSTSGYLRSPSEIALSNPSSSGVSSGPSTQSLAGSGTLTALIPALDGARASDFALLRLGFAGAGAAAGAGAGGGGWTGGATAAGAGCAAAALAVSIAA